MGLCSRRCPGQYQGSRSVSEAETWDPAAGTSPMAPNPVPDWGRSRRDRVPKSCSSREKPPHPPLPPTPGDGSGVAPKERSFSSSRGCAQAVREHRGWGSAGAGEAWQGNTHSPFESCCPPSSAFCTFIFTQVDIQTIGVITPMQNRPQTQPQHEKHGKKPRGKKGFLG